ncbi:MAG TPA: class I SAM-dependent methyltransferase [Thermoleophilaceae bacterium]|jgi:SAM-dependent methyltransferase
MPPPRSPSGRVRRATSHRLGLARDLALDAADRLRGRDQLVPPRRLLTGDYSEYERIGEEFRGYLVELAGLRPDGAVLDVGCGPGRMAVPLTRYLGERGRYEGFDVVGSEVRWCQRHITPRHPGFRFQVVDVHNPRYNPRGATPAAELRFPYEDGSFDVVLLASVFTHMLAPEVERYLGEVARVLRPGGRALVTYFLLNEDSEGRIAAGTSHFGFRGRAHAPARVEEPGDPEAAVAYPEEWVRERHRRTGIPVASVHHGYWCGRDEYLTWQDVVVAER